MTCRLSILRWERSPLLRVSRHRPGVNSIGKFRSVHQLRRRFLQVDSTRFRRVRQSKRGLFGFFLQHFLIRDPPMCSVPGAEGYFGQ